MTAFRELSNQILFNITIYEPHYSILDFVKKYIPFLADNRPRTWTASPPPDVIPVEQRTIHSVIFTSHPFINLHFSEGHLDFFTYERENKIVGYERSELWLSFDNKSDAELAFNRLLERFSNISDDTQVTNEGGRSMAKLSKEYTDQYYDQVLFILTRDELHNDKYKLLFQNYYGDY